MPTNRFQFSDDFTLNNGNVGINSATPQTKLDVDGVVKGESLKVTGVSSFTTYEGFLNSNQNIVENSTISGGGRSGSLSGEIIVGTGITVTVASDTTSSQGSIDSLKVYNTFTVPVGGTTDRPIKATPGQLFFNRDFATMEFWDGDRWRQVDNTTQRGRGVFAGGVSPTWSNIEYINISSLGNALNFGVLTAANHSQNRGSVSSSIRGLFCGGNDPQVNTIEYITIASEGNAIDFGDITTLRQNSAGGSSSTRGIIAGGFTTPAQVNVIDYVTISTLGNAIDFGDLYTSAYESGGVSSSTRMIIAGGNSTTSSITSIIQFITISSTGNSVFFGDLIEKKDAMSPMCNSVRGVFAGSEFNFTNTIEYITIASVGNSQDFGDLTQGKGIQNGVSNSTRGIIAGGYVSPGGANLVNTIEYITLMSAGNAQDFGDLTRGSRNQGSCSDSHGGLGGF